MLRAILPPPPSANRIWRRSGLTIHRSRAYQDWQEAALWALREQGGAWAPIEGPVAVAIDLVGRTGIDLDNVVKPTLDLLQHARVLADDRLVVGLQVRRQRTNKPSYLEVTVEQLHDDAPA